MGKWQMENGLAVSSSFVAMSHWQQGRLERNEAGGVSIVVMQARRKHEVVVLSAVLFTWFPFVSAM